MYPGLKNIMISNSLFEEAICLGVNKLKQKVSHTQFPYSPKRYHDFVKSQTKRQVGIYSSLDTKKKLVWLHVNHPVFHSQCS